MSFSNIKRRGKCIIEKIKRTNLKGTILFLKLIHKFISKCVNDGKTSFTTDINVYNLKTLNHFHGILSCQLKVMSCVFIYTLLHNISQIYRRGKSNNCVYCMIFDLKIPIFIKRFLAI